MFSIEINSLSKSYGSFTAVDGIDLKVERGKIFGFLGPNGAGKTTTMKMLTTLIPPSSGTMNILGIDGTKSPLEIRKKIGVVLQQPSYEPTLSVEKSLEKYGMMWNVEKKIRKNRVEELLVAFDLVDIRKKKNDDLSIGQRRRVQVAREFMHDMELLFLDEPTVGLDPSARRSLLDFIKSKVKDGLTIFFTTHILEEAEYLCDDIAIINKGKIIAVDTPTDLKNKFGREKTIKIHVLEQKNVSSLLGGIPGCNIEHDSGVIITVRSSQSEQVLQDILKILASNHITVEDLSVVPTSLEEIFLSVVKNSNA
ncbi:MAG: ABC transporter ATP-binding protein [Thaumarchaeota archaeon]|nr:ABC transporter ATP-binding protein [Nitrososphaerota archaeon]MDE1831872.1 ABC transporter ATP-binding protein [Nitrososphaerota archaeon]MDE1841609.1 ABC transporter ATP-binding protein [Nitrososphaerota archaeon]MDE1878302.1 ABC transporter ATP-binding protein [Nitrososphaerota archaeon]